MRATSILLLCILGAAMFSTVICNSAIGPDECCFSYYPRRIKRNLIRSYYMTDDRCAKPGVILVTRKSRNICADPRLSWAVDIMASLDEDSF